MRDITQFVYKNFDDVKSYSGSDSGLAVPCPFCRERIGDEDHKHHLQISTEKETCHCYRCDYAASWIGLVMDVLGCSYAFALGHLYVVPKPDLDLLSERLASEPSKLSRMRPTEFILPNGYIPLHGKAGSDAQAIPYAKRYLRKRGFGPAYWKRYQLGIYGGRVLIPIEGDFWQARAIFPFQHPKYMSPSDKSADVLFNAPALRQYSECAICEGAFSAMAIGDNAVALVGKNPTIEKVRRLVKANVRKYIITIEDKATKQMMALADKLVAGGKEVELWSYDNDMDPADWVEPTKNLYDFKQKLSMLLLA